MVPGGKKRERKEKKGGKKMIVVCHGLQGGKLKPCFGKGGERKKRRDIEALSAPCQ